MKQPTTYPCAGDKLESPDYLYKGDGVNTCKWCGDTGWMHTWSLDGYLYQDAPCCACELGRKILEEKLKS